MSIIKRGSLYFDFDTNSGIMKCTLGEPNDPESEYIFSLHKDYLVDLVAGIKAIVSIYPIKNYLRNEIRKFRSRIKNRSRKNCR